jgi:hypothetical protein
MITDTELARDALIVYANVLQRKARLRCYGGPQWQADREEWREMARRLRQMALWHGLEKP